MVHRVRVLGAGLLLVACMRPAAGEGLKQADRFEMAGRTATVLLLDTLPYVSSPLAEQFQPDRYGDPVLERLRQQENLDAVVAPGRSEFEKQLLLLEWAHRQIQYGDPVELGKERDPLKLLALSRKGRVLYCECFSSLFIAAAASLGWVSRPVDIPTHSFAEIWSNELRRWVMMDPTGHFYVDAGGESLNTLDIRKEWFENGGKNLVFRRGQERYQGGGRSFAAYTVVYYPFRREYLGNRPSDGYLAVVDRWSGSRRVPEERLLKDPDREAYFPVNQAALTLVPRGDGLEVSLRTLTPNFKTFRIRIDGSGWKECGEKVLWRLHDGLNLIEAQAVNLFGVGGPVSMAEVLVAEPSSREIVVPATAFSSETGGKVALRPLRSEVTGYVSMWNTSGHCLEWVVESPAEGDREVIATYAAVSSPLRQVSVNGAVVPGLERVFFGSTRSWSNFSTRLLPGRVHLKAGRNVLSMTCLDGSEMFLSSLRLTSPSMPDIVVEAARFTGEYGGKAARMVVPEYGYFRFWDAKDHWIEWTVDVPEEGNWTVFLQYATLYNDSLRDLSVDGATAPGLERFAPPMTGDWLRWSEWQLPAPVCLARGTHTLRMNNLNGKGINMAGLRLVGPSGRNIVVPAVSFTAQEGAPERGLLIVSPSRHRSLFRWDARGHALEWTVRTEAEGAHEVILRYACDRNASRSVEVNGKPADGLEHCLLESTGGMQAWREKKLPAPVFLSRGDNRLRLVNTGGSVNLDEIRVIRLDRRAAP